PVFDEFFSPSASVVFVVLEVPALVESTGSPSSTSVDQDAPSQLIKMNLHQVLLNLHNNHNPM
ncbi:hypothetical protein Tco_0544585, partial [Tanacetum coccineum]